MTKELKPISNLQLICYKLVALALAPGTAVCTMGVVAGIYTIIPPDWLHPAIRGVGIVAICLLGGLSGHRKTGHTWSLQNRP